MAFFSKRAFSNLRLDPTPFKRVLRNSEATGSINALLIDAQILAGGFPPLNLHIANRASATLGRHGRRRFGHGSDFWQFRNYSWDDSVSMIDWRQSARFDTLQVREREWQAQRALYIWSDPSPSCNWRSARHLPTKAQRAQEILLALAILALKGGESVAVLRKGTRPKWGGEVRYALAQELMQESSEWSPPPQANNQPESADESPATTLPELRVPDASSHIVLAGDFLDPPAPLAPYLRAVSASRSNGHTDTGVRPRRMGFAVAGRSDFRRHRRRKPVESPPSRRNGAGLRKTSSLRNSRPAKITRESGWGYLAHNTADPSGRALLSLHIRLSQRAGQGAGQGDPTQKAQEATPPTATA